MDNPAIGKFMVLWLVVTTKVGNNGGSYLTQLLANANGEQAALAGKLGLPEATVAQVITLAGGLPAFATIANEFHAQAGLAFPDDYDGGWCPNAVQPILDLIPGA